MRCRSPRDGERGSITAEFAIALPAILIVLAACLAALHVAGVHVRVIDAAAAAARSLGRGDSIEDAAARATRMVPGSHLRAYTRGDLECATVSVGVAASLTLRATSCALGGGR